MLPWDDDIDVLMPRPDYDRLLEIAKHEDFGKGKNRIFVDNFKVEGR